ncbi:hypothetical protein TWF694_003181 [Orbilia ellipsospora]|uniref:Phospholipase/carboxylesterase/thioesterase domain-containing protein n=1 Tax=Orbilia ellipsospora TaxID=2528407 RepID=A0AAV9X0U9_9PEZI
MSTSSDFPDPFIITPQSQHSHTIIFLHGRGSTGEELADSLSEVNLTKITTEPATTLFSHFPNIKWVFPSAKLNFSTVFQEEITEWFDISSLTDVSAKEELQIAGLKNTVPHLRHVVQQELDILNGDASKVIMAGISQGEATALMLLLLQEHTFGGFMGFSGWIPLSKRLDEASAADIPSLIKYTLGIEDEDMKSSADFGKTPVFLGHGVDDAWISFTHGRHVRDTLSKMGFEVVWKEYTGADEEGHWLKEPEEFDDIAEFIERITKG